MKINEWLLLSENSRRELIIRWGKDRESEYRILAEESAIELRIKLQSNPDVTDVHVEADRSVSFGVGESAVNELILGVCTLVPENRNIEGIPQFFSGFRVVQLHLKEKKDSFLRTFTFITKELMGWTSEKTLKWGNEYNPNESLDASLNGGGLFTVVYSEGPVALALTAIMEDLKKEHKEIKNNYLYEIRNKIYRIILDAVNAAIKPVAADRYYPDQVKGLDWGAIRIEVSNLIEKELKNRLKQRGG